MIADIKGKSYKTRDKTNSKEALAAKFKNKEKEESNSPDNLLDINYVKNEVAKDDKKFNENFELINSIKAGGSGAVYLGKLKKNKKDIAIKIINKQNVNNKEVSIHSRLKHHKIPVFYGFHPLGKNNSFIAMEYNKFGDLENFKRNTIKRTCLSETLISYITGNIVEALYYLHRNNIIHLDIKQQNILVDDSLNFKISDFSVSIKYDPKKKNINLPRVGTSYYMSPEVLEKKQISISDASKIDIYSLGVLLYFLAFNDYPYELDNVDYQKYNEILENIKKKELVFPKNSGHSNLFKNFLKKCLEKDINKRYNISQVMNDPWFKAHTIILEEKEKLYNAGRFMCEMLVDNIKPFNDYIKSFEKINI
jgi:serine/threonine protein kinase